MQYHYASFDKSKDSVLVEKVVDNELVGGLAVVCRRVFIILPISKSYILLHCTTFLEIYLISSTKFWNALGAFQHLPLMGIYSKSSHMC